VLRALSTRRGTIHSRQWNEKSGKSYTSSPSSTVARLSAMMRNHSVMSSPQLLGESTAMSTQKSPDMYSHPVTQSFSKRQGVTMASFCPPSSDSCPGPSVVSHSLWSMTMQAYRFRMNLYRKLQSVIAPLATVIMLEEKQVQQKYMYVCNPCLSIDLSLTSVRKPSLCSTGSTVVWCSTADRMVHNALQTNWLVI